MPVATTEIEHQLGQLGLRSGDAVMIHASLKAIGLLENGAVGLIEALDRNVGPQGLTMMVLGAEDNWAWVNERPTSERMDLLAESPPFDPLTTLAHAEVGRLAEIFRRCPGTIVSPHPEGRFAARGSRASAWMNSQPWDDYYGPGSPLDRLVRDCGKILRMGADNDTVTALHYAEYLANVPEKRRVCRFRRVVTPEGAEIRRVHCLDDEHGIVDYPGEDYFATILENYLDAGNGTSGIVGRAHCELIDAAGIVRFGVAWMNEHLR